MVILWVSDNFPLQEVMLSNETENVVCSPVSAMMPLGKLAIGVKGRAASELLEFLGINLQIEVSQILKCH